MRPSSIYRLAIQPGTGERLCEVAEEKGVEVTSFTSSSLSFRVRGGDEQAAVTARSLVDFERGDLTTGFGIHCRVVA